MKKSRRIARRIEELRELHVLRALAQPREELIEVDDLTVLNAAIRRLRERHLIKAAKRVAAKAAAIHKPMTCTEEIRAGGAQVQCGEQAMPQFDEETKEYLFHLCPRNHRSFAQRESLFDRGWTMGPNGRGMVPPASQRTERADPRAFPSQGRSNGTPLSVPTTQVSAAAELAQGIQSVINLTKQSGYSQEKEWQQVRKQHGLQ